MFEMREARSYHTILIIKFYHDHIFIPILGNKFYKIVIDYQRKK